MATALGPLAQQHDPRVVAMLRREIPQHLLQGDKERRQAFDAAIADHAGKHPREHDAIFQGVTDSRGRVRTIGHDAPRPVARANQVGRVQVQVAVAGHPLSRARPQEAGIGIQQFRGQSSPRQQAVRRIHVPDDRVQQPGALGHARRQFPPLLRVEQQRKQIDVPRAGISGIFPRRVRDAVFPQQPARIGQTPVQLFDSQLGQPGGQRPPVFADPSGGVHQFVIRIGPRHVARRRSRARRTMPVRESGMLMPSICLVVGPASAGNKGSVRQPGSAAGRRCVPKGRNLAARRASASNALTGNVV